MATAEPITTTTASCPIVRVAIDLGDNQRGVTATSLHRRSCCLTRADACFVLPLTHRSDSSQPNRCAAVEVDSRAGLRLSKSDPALSVSSVEVQRSCRRPNTSDHVVRRGNWAPSVCQSWLRRRGVAPRFLVVMSHDPIRPVPSRASFYINPQHRDHEAPQTKA